MKMDGLDSSFLGSKGKSSIQEFVLPHKLVVLALLKAYCDVKAKARSTDEIVSDEWIHSNQQQRNFSITLLKFIQGPAIQLKDLHELVKPILLPKTYTLFIEKLNELKNGGVATLMDFIQGLEILMIDPQFPIPLVHKSSVTGLFLRKIMLAFDKLSFSQVTHLYSQFKKYFDAFKDFGEITDTWSSESCGSLRTQNTLMEKYWKMTDSQITSKKQAELFIGQQAALLQACEIEAIPAKKLQNKIIQLLQNKPDLAEAQYLSFLNAIRVKEVVGATHSLYHCFDKAVLQQPVESKNHSNSSGEANNRSTRYAALNLAAFHITFGHGEEAMCALKEAIRIAHEANDNICLQHALMWMTRLDADNKETLLEHCIIKTADIGLPFLGALGLQALAQRRTFRNTEPTQIFEGMMRSDILICQHSMLDLMTNSYCQKAALWKTYGKTLMSSMTNQLLLHLNTSDPACCGNYHSDEGFCKAICSTALDFFHQGCYSECNLLISLAKSLFPGHSKNSAVWLACHHLTVYHKAVWEGKWDLASQAVKSLRIVDQEEGIYRLIELHFLMGQVDESSIELEKLLQNQDGDLINHFKARLMLLKVEILCHSENGSKALILLTDCLTLCQDHYLTYLEARTKLYISNIQADLKLCDRAHLNLKQAIIPILCNGSLFDQAMVHFIAAKCSIAKASEIKNEDKKRVLIKAIEQLESSAKIFQQIQALLRLKDCKYWLCMVYNEIGCKSERNRCAYEFRSLDLKGINRTGILTGLL